LSFRLSSALHTLKDRDAALEKWLRTEVAGTYDKMQRDPARVIPIKGVFEELRARHTSWIGGQNE
jgi:antitoxin ParD1/3/4